MLVEDVVISYKAQAMQCFIRLKILSRHLRCPVIYDSEAGFRRSPGRNAEWNLYLKEQT